MTDNATLIATRALNFVRREHPATYVGLRLLLDSTGDDIDTWLIRYLTRRYKTQKPAALSTYLVYKSHEGDSFEYRHCTALSPLSLLSEVWALSKLCTSSHFIPSKAVYSYLFSQVDSPHIFRSYLEEYFRRENDIADACQAAGANSVVVIADIHGFYPKAPFDNVLATFKHDLATSDLPVEQQELILYVLAPYERTARHKYGIPVGTPMGHVLAQQFLRDLDLSMSFDHPGRYFRYVDDIAIVCQKHEAEEVAGNIRERIAQLGLTHNPSKDDIVAGGVWSENRRTASAKRDRFSRLRRGIQTWANRTNDAKPIRHMLKEVGARIYITYVKDKKKSVMDAAKSLILSIFDTSGVDRVKEQLVDMRLELETSLTRAPDTNARETGMRRKWRVQNTKFTINRFLQLGGDPSHSLTAPIVSTWYEFDVSRVVARCLMSGSATEILKYPGPPTTTLATLWRSREALPMKVDLSKADSRHSRNSLYILMLYGVVDVSPEWIAAIDRPGERSFARFCSGAKVTERSFPNFGFVDEVESLYMTSPDSVASKLGTRHSRHEDVFDDDLWELLS